MSAASCSVVRIRALLAGPDPGEVAPADRPVAVDHHPHRLEDHALERRGAQHLRPARLLGGALRRVLVVDLLPGEVEDAPAEETGQDAQDHPERLIYQAHPGPPPTP